MLPRWPLVLGPPRTVLQHRGIGRRFQPGAQDGLLLRPNAAMPADARALLRADAVLLRDELTARGRMPQASPETRAHVAESIAVLEDALKATSVRQGT